MTVPIPAALAAGAAVLLVAGCSGPTPGDGASGGEASQGRALRRDSAPKTAPPRPSRPAPDRTCAAT